MDNSDIKILVSYKEEHPYVKTDIIVPIQTGRAIADRNFEGMIGDDTGDNISELNDKYNELSAQYWAWKNQDALGNPKYIGFMHWRRHFLFDEKLPRPSRKWLNGGDYYEFSKFDEEYFEYFSDDKICRVMDKYDIVLPKAYDFENYKYKSVRENYMVQRGQHIENYELMLSVLKAEYPEYKTAVATFEKGRFEYLCNMFVMRRDIFDEYSSFLFGVLKKIDDLMDYSHYSYQGYRTLAYLGEMILNVFILHYVEKHPEVKIKALDMGVLHHAEFEIQPKPAFKDNYTAVVVPCSNFYAPYLSVYIQSIIDSSDKNHNYDIVVFNDDISDVNKEKLKYGLPDNFSLRFINVSGYFENINLKSSKGYLSVNSYYRLVIPKVMKNYKKVIVTDIDLIFEDDIAKLDEIDLKDAPIAACIEPQEGINLNTREEEREYSKNILRLEDPYRYYNTGVMLMNIEVFKEEYIKDMLRMIDVKYRCHEQCILNSYFDGKIKKISADWNFEATLNPLERENSMPLEMRDEYLKASENPKVLHWPGPNKPWKMAAVNLGFRWWLKARKTVFYEEILMRYSEILAIRQIKNNNK